MNTKTEIFECLEKFLYDQRAFSSEESINV
jgi:hypothetical protein